MPDGLQLSSHVPLLSRFPPRSSTKWRGSDRSIVCYNVRASTRKRTSVDTPFEGHGFVCFEVCYQLQNILILKQTETVNPSNPELNPICYLLALLAHHFLHVSRIRVKSLLLRLLMSYIYTYIYGAPILDVSRSHTTTQHSR